jgi:hypothetical protein
VRDWRTGSNDKETDPKLISIVHDSLPGAKECSESANHIIGSAIRESNGS